MKILKADYILTPTQWIKNSAVAFDKTIVEVGNSSDLCRKFPHARLIDTPKNSFLLPGLINSHVHLEFSANRSALTYGGFVPWLKSVIAKREELLRECQEECYREAILAMLQSGITSFGAISSYGLEMQACIEAPQKVVFFNELIGSRPDMVDLLFSDFSSRLKNSQRAASETFIPAVAIHSPYAVHPVLIKKAVALAKEDHLALSTHFLESLAEREWLDNDNGEFAPFFESFLGQKRAANRPLEFLELFEGTKTLFVHAVHANKEELGRIAAQKGYIIHCPVSNRLLNNGILDIARLEERGIPMLLSTDGLSSNYSLSLFDEMRAALFMHSHTEPSLLADMLLKSVTINPAKALNLNCGQIDLGFDADMIVVTLPQKVQNESQIALHLILHTKKVQKIFINGVEHG